MAAYAALVSVMQIIDQIQHHPLPPITLDRKQAESLTESISFFQEFLESYNPRVSYSTEEADPLESRIAEAAYAAEDVIEPCIVDQIHARSQNYCYPKKLDLFKNQRARLDLFLDSVHFHAQSQPNEVDLSENLRQYILDQINVQSQNHGYPSAAELFAKLNHYIQDQFHAESQNHDYLNEEDFLEDFRAYMHLLTNDGKRMTCIQIFQCVPTLISYIAQKIQGFLNPRVCYRAEAILLESRMAEAADVIESYIHAAADVIESYIHSPSTNHGKNTNSIEFFRSLQEVIEDMDLIWRWWR